MTDIPNHLNSSLEEIVHGSIPQGMANGSVVGHVAEAAFVPLGSVPQVMANAQRAMALGLKVTVQKRRGRIRKLKELVNCQSAAETVRLREEIAVACEKRMSLIEELENVRGIIAPAKASKFLRETQLKDEVEMARLQDVERQIELRAVEKELFVQKLLRNCFDEAQFYVRARSGVPEDWASVVPGSAPSDAGSVTGIVGNSVTMVEKVVTIPFETWRGSNSDVICTCWVVIHRRSAKPGMSGLKY
nr:hypothetical protein [Tanacetum cinerariifolium]